MTEVTFQKIQISDGLAENGWELIERSDREEWWVDEVWMLKSKWRPTTATALLTFVIDPQYEGPRGPGEGVWAVACSREPLGSWMDTSTGSLIQISPGWQREQPKFWRRLAELRGG